jgi:hypothetical protein
MKTLGTILVFLPLTVMFAGIIYSLGWQGVVIISAAVSFVGCTLLGFWILGKC